MKEKSFEVETKMFQKEKKKNLRLSKQIKTEKPGQKWHSKTEQNRAKPIKNIY